MKKEYLLPEDSTENATYARYASSQRSDDAKKMVLVDANREPYPDVSQPIEVVDLDPTESAKVAEKRYQCGGCEEPFDDPIWQDGKPYCPICEAELDKDAIDNA